MLPGGSFGVSKIARATAAFCSMIDVNGMQYTMRDMSCALAW
jgi:hypothetical protein